MKKTGFYLDVKVHHHVSEIEKLIKLSNLTGLSIHALIAILVERHINEYLVVEEKMNEIKVKPKRNARKHLGTSEVTDASFTGMSI